MVLDDAFVTSRKYNLGVQRCTQITCCVLFAMLCAVMMLNDSTAGFETQKIWSTATFALSVGGIVAASFGVAGVQFHVRWLLFMDLGYVAVFLTYRVLYTAFPLSKETKNWYYMIEIVITALIVLVNWVQLYYSLFFFRLLRFHDVYHRHPKGRAQMVPTEDLVSLMQTLGQKPTPSQVVELLSFVSVDATTFTFKEFCQMEAHLLKMRSVQQRRERRVSRSKEPLLAERRSSSVRGRDARDAYSFSHHNGDEDYENTKVLVRDVATGEWLPLDGGPPEGAPQRHDTTDDFTREEA